MRRLVFDIETERLEDPQVIHCICTLDYSTGETREYTSGNLQDFVDYYKSEPTILIGHNAIGFDIPVVNRLLHLDVKVKDVRDTAVLSRLSNYLRQGGHSLENWGKILGDYKQDFTDFSTFTPEMLEYCKQDVQVCSKIYTRLNHELRGYTKESILLEHQVAHILHQQKETGFYLHKDKALDLYTTCKTKAEELEVKIKEHFKPKRKFWKTIVPKYNQDGSLSKVTQKQLDKYDCTAKPDGTYDVFVTEEFNLGSPKQIVERMTEAGWKPVDFTKKGAPKITEKNLKTLPDTAPEAAKLLPQWWMCTSRWKTVKQWLDGVDDNNRVHGSVFHIGATTHRMSHSNPNMANIPAVPKDKEGNIIYGLDGSYGFECRDCWGVSSSDRKLVGADASGIQLRILAHYINDPSYTDEVVNGDVHTKNQELAGLETRDQAKTFIYAWLLGAGDAKIGQIVGGTYKDGREIKERFLARLPGLALLKEQTHSDAQRGYMIGLDGRRIPVQSAHLALASYLQGGEAVIMKKALVMSYTYFMMKNIDAKFVANVHDEVQIDCHEQSALQAGETMVHYIKEAGKHYNLNCPLDAQYIIGNTWAETH